MLPVIQMLAARGETVRAVVGRAFAEAVRDAGAEAIVLEAVPDVFVPERLVGGQALRFVTDRARRPAVNARAARSLARELRRRRPDLIVLDPMIGWADRVARRYGIPSAVFSTTYADSDEVFAAVRGVPRWLSLLRPSAGSHRLPDRLVLVNAVPDLQPAADSLAGDVHFVGPLLCARRVGWDTLGWQVPDRHRLLYASSGTVFARGPAFFRTIADAFADQPWLVVLATGQLDPGELGALPSNVVARRHVPQQAVLDRSDVFLTHAGMNSSLEGLAAGVPMALVPRSSEQRFLAGRLAALGVGTPVEISRDQPLQVRRVITMLADDPAVRAATDAWRRALERIDGPRMAADLLCGRARRYRGPWQSSEADR